MKKTCLFIALLFLLISCASQKIDKEVIKADIHKVLSEQQKHWNEHSVEGYVSYYWKSDELTFQSTKRKTKGWNTLLESYKKSYPPEKMGNLEFKDLVIKVTSAESAYVTGSYHVTLDGKVESGMFTLIFMKKKEGWRIVHDQTS